MLTHYIYTHTHIYIPVSLKWNWGNRIGGKGTGFPTVSILPGTLTSCYSYNKTQCK